jgi:photosystem II stability/assembly factor-like uncharacterized protein
MTTTDNSFTASSDLPDIVNSLAASPRFEEDGVCFAGRTSGLYRSDDGGRSWHPAYGALELTAPLATMAVAVSPAFESDHSLFAGVNGGVLRSLDGGTTWHAAILASPAPLVTTLAVSPDFARDGIVLAGTMEDGVFRSADRGSSWSPWNFGLLDLTILSLAISPNFARDETIFAGTESGLFRSTNGGRAWREVDFPTELAPVLSLALSPDYARDGMLFVGTEFHGLLSTDDCGRTWNPRGEEVMTAAVNAIVLAPEFPTRRDVLILLSNALLISRDGGDSWSEWKPGLTFEESTASIAAPHGLGPGAPLLVGLVERGVVRVS